MTDSTAAEVSALFGKARRALDLRDAASSAQARRRHDATAWFYANEGWRRLHGGDALQGWRH